MLTLLIAAAVLAACTGLRRFLNREGRKDRTFWGGRIRLTALWNDGAAFSLPLKRTLVSALSILILPLVWVFRRRSPIGAGLALGGGLSNLWERLKNRRVRMGNLTLDSALPRGSWRFLTEDEVRGLEIAVGEAEKNRNFNKK